MRLTVSRYHDISCGHRVVGHEGKCRGLHGHNYRVHFECVAPELDEIGRVIDFSVVKAQLCNWLEDYWDHGMLIWDQDPASIELCRLIRDEPNQLDDNLIIVPFNPTAENMALYLLHSIAPVQLTGTGVTCIKIVVEETRKCLATASL